MWRYLSAIAHGAECGLAAFMTDVGPTADPRHGDRKAAIEIKADTAAASWPEPLGRVQTLYRIQQRVSSPEPSSRWCRAVVHYSASTLRT